MSAPPRIVLASQSPSRAGLLRAGGMTPLLRPADIDEQALIDRLAGAASEDIVAQLALAKATAIAGDYPKDVVIGADSMLLLDGQLQGKPHTVDATVARWAAQAGRSAQLLTGHAVLFDGREYIKTSVSTVHFGQASAADIAAYAASGEPLECAGAFTIEALGGWFIDAIEGDPSSVIGLSLPVIRAALYHFGLEVHQFWAPPAS